MKQESKPMPSSEPMRHDSFAASMIRALDNRFYPGYVQVWDDVVCREMMLSLIGKHHTVLDVGAGAGIHERTWFRGHAARVCGVDPDPRVAENTHLDEGRIGFADSIPYPDATFDLAFAWNVVEHLTAPDRVFREVARVLKPGGVFVIKTPNLWHYVTLTSRLLPHSLHDAIISRIFKRTSPDIFPTVYRCNTQRRIRRLAAATGFRVREFRHLEPRPDYLRFSPITYLFGIAYERTVNSTLAFQQFRVALIAVLEKGG